MQPTLNLLVEPYVKICVFRVDLWPLVMRYLASR
jgi:hypothetical protein